MAYGVVRTDLMYATDVRSGLVSIKYMGADGETDTAIENGNVLLCGGLMEGEREIRLGAAVAANSPLEDVVLVATPELLYDDRLHNLDEFINLAGVPCRGYRLHNGDVFSVTKECLTGAATPAVGDVVELAAGTKLKVVAADTGATEGSTVVGVIDEIQQTVRYKYYVIRVTM